MRFGPVPLDEAEGAVLAHSLKAGAVRLKKGRVLTADDLAALSAEGVGEVIAARLGNNDVAEDEAADILAAAIAGPGTRAAPPFTGRANLYAELAGLLAVDRDRIDAVNLVDEAITLATLTPYEAVAENDMLATVKIIPFAAPRAALDRVLEIVRAGPPLLTVAPFRAMTAGLVATTLPGLKDSILDKTRGVTDARLAQRGSGIGQEDRVPHAEADVARAIGVQIAAGLSPILVFGASATVDRRDAVPAGIVAAGGEVMHYGMPVDPGNLLVMGRVGDTPVIGLPGCARSPKLNGFDWVLDRVLCGLEVTPRDIMRMGAGGLLKEIPTRPQPRDNSATSKGPRKPRIAALLLAAGQSRRMGAANKLLEDIGGVPMVVRVADTLRESQVDTVIAVTGHEAERVSAALEGHVAASVQNPSYAEGLSTSLKAGLASLPPDVDAVLVALGDMPGLSARDIDRLIAAFNPVEGRAIVVPTYKGKRGNPVLWGRQLFSDMKSVSGDTGARHLIGEHADLVTEVEMQTDAALTDLDTPEMLSAYRNRTRT
ncbi:molybdopterin-binding/glycosyltransferase family 2 protein [Futiania mangrovi]|uniref:Molybdopterin-binding/glycosyltransferase family 2 protein n=1 Tax=Futiania mangrovi TaxID=2959716 RepID=A0A9J6PCP2_9PROT|nr:molybdopterin-binding/glycosyltransferase family 2 protein [Futiania mangrovii]MCP1336046.1 molybdopterin-binding/glycosyltransferase family 2 protein [Futiania mangrovii]